MTTGLFIGRFQPFHLGHLETIKYALKIFSRIIIAIGSAQKSYEIRNPFTAGERIQMIQDSLSSYDLKNSDFRKILLIPIPDLDVHYLWTYNLDILVPKYDTVLSNDPFTISLFKDRKKNIIEPPLLNRTELSATEIRNKIVNNDDNWIKLVPKETAKIIYDINGIDRIKLIHLKYSENMTANKHHYY